MLLYIIILHKKYGVSYPTWARSRSGRISDIRLYCLASYCPASHCPASHCPASHCPASQLPGKSLPGKSLPGKSLPGKSLPGKSLPAEYTVCACLLVIRNFSCYELVRNFIARNGNWNEELTPISHLESSLMLRHRPMYRHWEMIYSGLAVVEKHRAAYSQ